MFENRSSGAIHTTLRHVLVYAKSGFGFKSHDHLHHLDGKPNQPGSTGNPLTVLLRWPTRAEMIDCSLWRRTHLNDLQIIKISISKEAVDSSEKWQEKH